jgi:hypothetical protein
VRDAALVTGTSEETIDRALDGELGNLRAEPLLAALTRELGDPEVLDGFKGGTAAVGPRTVLAVFSGQRPRPARAVAGAGAAGQGNRDREGPGQGTALHRRVPAASRTR